MGFELLPWLDSHADVTAGAKLPASVSVSPVVFVNRERDAQRPEEVSVRQEKYN